MQLANRQTHMEGRAGKGLNWMGAEWREWYIAETQVTIIEHDNMFSVENIAYIHAARKSNQ